MTATPTLKIYSESSKKVPNHTASYLVETDKTPPPYSNHEIRCLLEQIAEKWTLLILELLEKEPKRFTTLRHAMKGVSQKMLTQTLRELERNGIVRRKVYAQVPPRVDYALTPLGRSLCKSLATIRRWVENHAEEIVSARAAYDTKTTKHKTDRGAPIRRAIDY